MFFGDRWCPGHLLKGQNISEGDLGGTAKYNHTRVNIDKRCNEQKEESGVIHDKGEGTAPLGLYDTTYLYSHKKRKENKLITEKRTSVMK